MPEFRLVGRGVRVLVWTAAFSLWTAGWAAGQAPFSVLHEFSGSATPEGPTAAPIQARDGNFYGTTYRGGTFNLGTIFRLTPTGVVSELHSFDGVNDGACPTAALLEAADGNFYGTTTQGGAIEAGTLFRLTPAGTFTVLNRFDGGRPSALVQGTDGNLYGTTTYGGHGAGSAFRMALDGSVTVLHSFVESTEGSSPLGLTLGPDGNFYGTTRFMDGPGYCTDCGKGTAFRMTPNGTLTVLHVFKDANEGGHPWGATGLIRAADGTFYGSVESGGAFGYGALFRLTSSGNVTVVHAYTGEDDIAYPPYALVEGTDGQFYGASRGGPSGGKIFRMDSNGYTTLLATFTRSVNGSYPLGFVRTADGRLYGATDSGGAANIGTLFVVDLDGTLTALHQFLGTTEGAEPRAPLMQASDGNLYGTTLYGGVYNHGTIFRIAPSGAFTVLYAFAGGLDGGTPRGALVQGTDGRLYGTTSLNGAYDGGTIFQVTLGGQLTTVHAFAGGSDGQSPQAGLIQARDGNFYGTTMAGGDGGCDLGCGTVFRMTPDGVVTVLHAFAGSLQLPQRPFAPLLQASDGNLYGSTAGMGFPYSSTGGSGGTLFRLSLAGTLTTLRSFSSAESFPSPAPLVQSPDGSLYGATICGNDGGAFFRMSLDGVFVPVAPAAAYCGSGRMPVATLTLGRDGRVYGTIWVAFAQQSPPYIRSFRQTLFVLTSAGAISRLYELSGVEIVPQALVQAADGALYGVTSSGGASGAGFIFRVTPIATAPSAVTVTTRATGAVHLSWPEVATAAGYLVKRADSSGGETVLASNVAGTGFDDLTAIKGHHYYYIVTALNAFGESTPSYEVSITAGRPTPGDFDRDGRADVVIDRPSTGTWWILDSASGFTTYTTSVWGLSGDMPVSGDFEGDGQSDVTIYRPSDGSWWMRWSSWGGLAYSVATWGLPGDVSVPADYDGDGITDLAVYRPSTATWWILSSSTRRATYRTHAWGIGTDVPVPADYDGDGKADPAVYRPTTGEWWILRSSANYADYTARAWGLPGDLPMPGDYDGDGKADLTVYRPSTADWWILTSSSKESTYRRQGWGKGGDVPVPADYDGDGQTDLAIYRPATLSWWILWSSTNGATYSTLGWGLPGDVPVRVGP
ncbi:MAG: choice-of-anchor tandem repeat GloVer-containing protein [Vicinamibacterales bacterium]